jgi:glutamate-ammonia-ligase adenylyltransferase
VSERTAWDLSAIPGLLRSGLEARIAQLDGDDGWTASQRESTSGADRGASPAADVRAAAAAADLRETAGTADLPRVWACSDFVADACLRDRDLLAWLFDGRRLYESIDEVGLVDDLARDVDADGDDPRFMDALRRFRRRQLVRIAWRDLAGLADVETVLGELSRLADVCIRAACRRAAAALEARHGAPRYADGRPMELLVLGMGKLGGGELNFSSDIDLVFLFPEHGEPHSSWAPRPPKASSIASTCA